MHHTAPAGEAVAVDAAEQALRDHLEELVGAKVGAELQTKALQAVLFSFVLTLVYLAFRFELRFGLAAVIATAHDILITLGFLALFRVEIALPTVAAILTILGYSLNDTIVIYDRIRENMDRYSRTDLAELINVSINETLARTLATSVTTALAICAFLFLGGPVIQNFAFAMLLGVFFGTYSTIFVASPMILFMEEVKPHLNRLVAGAVTDENEDDDLSGMTDEAELSESEKRRRARRAEDTTT